MHVLFVGYDLDPARAGPVRVDTTVYTLEEDLAGPAPTTLDCSTPAELFSSDDLDPMGYKESYLFYPPL